MNPNVKKIAIAALLMAPMLSLSGSCRKPSEAGNAGKSPDAATAMADSAASPVKPDPDTAVKFSIVYQNNINGEIEPCG